jgi:hypothetical protein
MATNAEDFTKQFMSQMFGKEAGNAQSYSLTSDFVQGGSSVDRDVMASCDKQGLENIDFLLFSIKCK